MAEVTVVCSHFYVGAQHAINFTRDFLFCLRVITFLKQVNFSMATHNEIAAALTKIYLFFIQIGYLLESEISWPAAGDDRLDAALCKSKGLDDTAIALIKAIPWPTNWCHLAINSGATNWSDEWDIESSRYPAVSLLNPEEGDEVAWIGSSEVPLTLSTQGESAGVVLLIDAKTGNGVQ